VIEVRDLTKRYGAHTAVSHLSFTIENGKIYGFLGPNGAGKSTTMNVIAGYLGASEGTVLIDGKDIMDEPMAAKRGIGYLPEQPPLYMDMTPKEYLRFVADAKGVKKAADEVEAVMEKTGIAEVGNRLIRNLSKGYKQRVGLAQALLGNPGTIILDEPTVGLDPAQIIEIRELIRNLGADHTIVLSSHILSEVQAICDHIMIISRGQLVASDTTENLSKRFAGETTLTLEARGDAGKMEEILRGVDSLDEINVKQNGESATAEVTVRPETDPRADVFTAFAKAGMPLLEMTSRKASLEDVFLELTQGDEPGISAEMPEEEPEQADEPAEEKTEESDETEVDAQ